MQVGSPRKGRLCQSGILLMELAAECGLPSRLPHASMTFCCCAAMRVSSVVSCIIGELCPLLESASLPTPARIPLLMMGL